MRVFVRDLKGEYRRPVASKRRCFSKNRGKDISLEIEYKRDTLQNIWNIYDYVFHCNININKSIFYLFLETAKMIGKC